MFGDVNLHGLRRGNLTFVRFQFSTWIVLQDFWSSGMLRCVAMLIYSNVSKGPYCFRLEVSRFPVRSAFIFKSVES
jgi:hypothetical protein